MHSERRRGSGAGLGKVAWPRAPGPGSGLGAEFGAAAAAAEPAVAPASCGAPLGAFEMSQWSPPHLVPFREQDKENVLKMLKLTFDSNRQVTIRWSALLPKLLLFSAQTVFLSLLGLGFQGFLSFFLLSGRTSKLFKAVAGGLQSRRGSGGGFLRQARPGTHVL